METYLNIVKIIADTAGMTVEVRSKAVEDLLNCIDTVILESSYQLWLDNCIPMLLKCLEGEPQFITELPGQQLRKGILETIHRLPCNDMLRPHCKNILNVVFKIVETDNEENVIICLRIVIELHKQFRPPYATEVQQFLNYVKQVYTELPAYMDKIFDPALRGTILIPEISQLNITEVLGERFAATQVQTEKVNPDGSPVTFTLQPRAKTSLKVLQELPIIVVLMYQIYKTSVQTEVGEFIPVVMSTISLHANQETRDNPHFNKEVLVEFMGAQVKTLSFLAYIIKLYQDLVIQHSHLLVAGMISLLKSCPMEVAGLRRELFIATRHIMGTELRFKFVPYMEQLLDEDVLLGKGWTVNETMRPLAYSTMADLVHHVRQHLSLVDLNRAVLFFSCHVHDESIPLSIQTMSCKLMFNLVESIRHKSEAEGGNGREILMRMLDVLVYKFKIVAEVHIPYFQEKYISLKEDQALAPVLVPNKKLWSYEPDEILPKHSVPDDVKRFGFPVSPMQTYSFSDCKNLVKTIVCAVKTISWGIASCKVGTNEPAANTPNTYKQFSAKETEVYLRLIKWGLRAIDIYAITGPVVPPNGSAFTAAQRPLYSQGVRSKDEKEVLEHFAGAFTLLNTYTFREIFSVSIDLLVQRIHENNALQVVTNNLLANQATSAIFATILVEYLLNKMPEMGDDVEKSNLYLRLFKLVFGSVSLFPNENEQMLRPHLREIVNKSMELAMNAKDPFNYFLLLRALFRSIGGGSHDLLYQEFLPLLPSLLQGLNSLQSGLHKHHMKDLFVELCLTVPVRLSSLLPYLPMLMDPLVSALNGSPTLISQGLRTLELCVDNLQPEFLYEHIQPVRADLMQALWRTLRNVHDPTAVVSFRILGKFGGSNRKMLVEPQKLEYSDGTNIGQCITLTFADHKTPVLLPLEKVIEVAVQTLRSTNTPTPSELYYQQQAWSFVKIFVFQSFELESDRTLGNKILLHHRMSDSDMITLLPIHRGDDKYRSILITALSGWFIATGVKELRKSVYSFLVPLLRHMAMVMTVQQTGSFAGRGVNMDPYIIFDAMAAVLANEEKDLKRPVLFGLSVIMNCVINLVRSKDVACSLPMIGYITDKFSDLCYKRAWYTKMGGCQAISFFLDNMSLRWTLSQQGTILRAMFFVLTDLTNEVSAGTVDLAKENLTKMIRICCACSDDNLSSLKNSCISDMTKEFTRQLTSPITNIRTQSMKALELLAEIQGKTISAVMEQHKDVLNEMVLPKKHVIRHQSLQCQLGILDGITFCLSLQPTLYPLDATAQETKVFINEVMALSDADDNALSKLPCYKIVSSLIPIRISLLNVLACVGHLAPIKDKVAGIFLKAIGSPFADLQKCGYECLKKFSHDFPVDLETQTTAVRMALSALTNIRTVTQPVLSQLSYLYQLFPHAITDKVWEQLLQLYKKCLEFALVSHQKAPARTGVHELKIAVAILDMFHLINAGSTAAKLMEIVTKFCLQAEKALMLGKGSPLRLPLMKFLIKQPKEFIDIAFSAPYIQSQEWNRFFICFLEQSESEKLRACLIANPSKLIHFLNIKKNPTMPGPTPIQTAPTASQLCQQGQAPQPPPAAPNMITLTTAEQIEIQYFAVKVMSILSDYDEDWILGNTSNRGEVVQALRKVWESAEYQNVCNSTSSMFMTQPATTPSADPTVPVASPSTPPIPPTSASPNLHLSLSKLQVQTWKEPQMIAKLLLSYYRKNNGDFDMLFKLLLAFCGKSISQYHFLKEFLDKTVTKYSVTWKRQAFYAFSKFFHDPKCAEELKAKIIQYILIPCFSYCFEKGQADELIGSSPEPDIANPNNLVNIFILNIIDPETQTTISDSVRILLYQFACLLVDQVPNHIHDASNKKQGVKLKRLMTFTWPCLLSKSCVDSSTKYYGHLLLCHIITKFALNKRIVLQTFHSLLKASLLEAKSVVKQALDIITPALPSRMDDGYTMLIHWTKKILVEEGHSLGQLMHLLQLIVRHWKVYYPVRHGVVQHMVSGITRLGFTPTSTFDQRKLAVEMAEVIIKWELERIKNETPDGEPEEKRTKLSPSPYAKLTDPATDASKPLDATHIEAVLSFLLRIACQVNEPNPSAGSQGEALARRCISLVKLMLRPEVWKQGELKIQWFEKLFATLDSPQVNYPNICTALELLAYIIGILDKPAVLEHMKFLQKGITACMTCQNSKVIRQVHQLLTKLTSIFPTEFPGGSGTSTVVKYDELEPLYTCVSKVIYEGLSTYDKLTNANPQTLLGPIMMCKATCSNSPGYIDRIITAFMKCLQKLAREHLTPAVNDAYVATELLIISLELVKNRVGVMGGEMRKAFIGQVLVSLIEKSTDTKVIGAIVKMLEDWVKNRAPHAVNQGPTIREKSILLVKLMQNVEKRFPTDLELTGMFLELINFIYRDESLKSTELNGKLEPAFLSGLRCVQPSIRDKFFQVFDTSIRRKLHERLMYIVCSQNWEAMGPHYWVKQCEELLFATASDVALDIAPKESIIPSESYGFSLLEQPLKDAFCPINMETTVVDVREHEIAFVQQLEKDVEALQKLSDSEDEAVIAESITKLEDAFLNEGWIEPAHPDRNMKYILKRENDFIQYAAKGFTTHSLLQPMVQLCHLDTTLSEKIWISFFPRAWKIFTEKQQLALANEMVPFLCSGVHAIQQHCHPSALSTFVEALCQCTPSIPMKPAVLFYLGKSHNLWHRMSLLLEQLALDCSLAPPLKAKKDTPIDCYEFEPTTSTPSPATTTVQQQEILDSLAELYSSLKEDDLWAGLWQKRAKYPETNSGIAYELQGYYEKAQGCYEVAMTKAKSESVNSLNCFSELKLWEDHWTKCAKELNQWDFVLDYSSSKSGADPFGVLEASWRNSNWATAKEALAQVELGCPKEKAWKVHLYRGYLAVCFSEDQNLSIVERFVESAQTLCIKEWKRLPNLVAPVHVPLLQAAQQVVELHEATLIHQALLHARQNTMNDTKSVVKTWRNRLPCISDDLSHWSDIFTWRQLHYQFVSQHYVEGSSDQGNQTMLGVHASAQAICHFGKIARKHNQSAVCLDSLSKIYTIPSVPIVDCFQKIKQQVKYYIQQSQILGRNELSEALEIVESTNLKYFSKEMTSEFFALKGSLLAQIGRSDDANKAFSAACQMHDANSKSWGLWGDYLESLFTRDPRNMTLGISAITAFMHACRHNQETKARKYIAKIIWLLMYDDEKGVLADTVDKYCMGVPPIQWLPWVPQLLNSLVRQDGKMVINLLNQVGRMYPQAVYFPIRTLYLTLKVEQRDKVRNAEIMAAAAKASLIQEGSSSPSDTQPGVAASPAAEQAIRATPSMWRCSKLMHMQRDLHPTILASLEGIVDQIIWFRENWYEEVLRQLKNGLAKCYAIAFENRTNLLETAISAQLQNFVKKLVSMFGHGSPLGNPPVMTSGTGTTPTIEALLLRRSSTHDPSFQQMKIQFSLDFDSAAPGAIKLHNLILRLRKWIKILEGKCKLFPKSFLMEDKYRFLLNFNSQIADIELPGKFLIPKHAHYYVKIARFQPRIEIVQKHNFCARRIYIRGHNGKIYPYLIAHDSCLSDARREERVVQMIRMLNHYLGRQKVTAKRNLRYTVPKVVPVSPQMRLVEDNPASLSLLDVFKISCAKKQIEFDAAIGRYYEKIASTQASGPIVRGGQMSSQVLRDILHDIQINLVPRTMFREWALSTFSSPSDYWMFRKIFTLQLCLSGFAEYVFHLTRLNPDILFLHKDSGMVNISYFKFDLDESTGELETIKPVPFRLTPNIAEFMTTFGVHGPLVQGMTSLARCLIYPNYKLSAILRAILRDEMASWIKKKQDDRDMMTIRGPSDSQGGESDSEAVINMVTKAVNAIMARIQLLCNFDGVDNNVSSLVTAANSHENLCRMDPTWHPWL